MYKKFKALGSFGKFVFDTAKGYYKKGGKKTQDIMKESSVSKSTAKSDIKSEIRRRVLRGGRKPSDFYNKPKGR